MYVERMNQAWAKGVLLMLALWQGPTSKSGFGESWF